MTPASFVPFSPAVPALDAFPRRAWEKAIAKAWRDLDQADLGYSRPGGYGPLREAIADHMRETRGVRCDVEQVIVTSGTQQALSLVARVVLDPGDVVWTEDPCFYGLHVLLRTMRARVVPVPVDADGIVVEDGIATAPDAKVAFVSPSHQYPLGTTMSLSRRLQLLRWAREMGAWLVEDDYDSEFRFSGYPLQALQGLDPSGRVIYTGTFSKSLFPSLRLGYLVVPPALLDPVAAAQAFGDRGASLMAQVALHRFMVSGQFGRHIRTMRLLYARRQQALLEAVATHLADLIDIDATPAGLHAVGWFRGDVDDVAASTALRDAGIEAPSVSSMALGEVRRRGLVLGYTTPEDALLSAAERARGILLGAGVRPWS
ncbi:MAG: PLP-dependent aminotransferase family protein [Trueperaceae bacterium]